METVHKIGRRKTAVARVYLSEGDGTITINKREFKNYFIHYIINGLFPLVLQCINLEN